MAEIIGIDHIYITVCDLAKSESFYDQVLVDAFGFRKNKFALAGDPHVQYFNRHFGFVLRPAKNSGLHDPYAPGLHHLCLRVESPQAVSGTGRKLPAAGIEAPPPSLYPQYAPDYHATFF